jgi:hypothetical protein
MRRVYYTLLIMTVSVMCLMMFLSRSKLVLVFNTFLLIGEKLCNLYGIHIHIQVLFQELRNQRVILRTNLKSQSFNKSSCALKIPSQVLQANWFLGLAAFRTIDSGLFLRRCSSNAQKLVNIKSISIGLVVQCHGFGTQMHRKCTYSWVNLWSVRWWL